MILDSWAMSIAELINSNKEREARTACVDIQRNVGLCQFKLIERARELAAMRRAADMEYEYQVVAEMLEYFEGYNLATWAPLAAIIRRERVSAIDTRLTTGDSHE